ncbi:MAG: SSU ribosomal protein S1p [uncultured Campylobacterales bacterium]|uniref:SSU ribosomal protein S1p n=1 Tax=uncultured Campylobacterales bacterium TaxID=352960 RepID=A0A6S6SPZ5_9BACT|nr:MAG: SSU ribosomal protein S1p [uncultured Campylobacterales bacterium]
MTQVDDKVLENAEQDNFAALLEASFKSNKQQNAIKTAMVVEVRDDVILVDVGQKSEGRLNVLEVQDEDGNISLNTGDELEVVIVGSYNGAPIVSCNKAKAVKKNEEFIKNYNEADEETVEGNVINKNKGGFVVAGEDGVNFFLPKSQVPFKRQEDLVGKNIKALVNKIDKDNNSIVISIKKYITQNIAKKQDKIAEILKTDNIIDGVIKKITSYGMFVDIDDGVEGLVHYTEISHKGSINPSSMYKEGEVVPVKVIKYDQEKGHLSLSIKAATENPWEEIQDNLDVGDTIQVTVNSIEPYGAFVDLGNDVEGFLHISEISWENNLGHPNEYLKLDDEINVEVVEINIEKKRLRVSLKNLLPKPFDLFINNHKTGDTVTGKISSLTDFGAFVKIDGVEGLLHNENISWEKNQKAKDLYKKDEEIEVVIAHINTTDKKISLNRKILSKNPVEEYNSNNKVGDIVTAPISDIKEFGVFLNLGENLDGLIRNEDLGETKKEELEVGQDIECVVDFIDTLKNRIRLSIKKLSRIQERQALKDFNNDEEDNTNTLGDFFK